MNKSLKCFALVVLMLLLFSNFWGCSHKSTNANSESSNNNQENYNEYGNDEFQIVWCKNFSGGVAQISGQNDDGSSVDMLINKNGSVLYACKDNEDIRSAPSAESAIGYTYNSTEQIYNIININGKIIKSISASENLHVIATGGGYALVFQCVADIDRKEFQLGCIDSEGNWTIPLKSYEMSPEVDATDIVPGCYAGDGMFDISVDGYGNDHLLLNAKTGDHFYFYVGYSGYKDYKDDVIFENGIDYFICNNSGLAYHAFISKTFIDINDNTSVEYQTPHDFILHTSGFCTEIHQDSPLLNGFKKAGDRYINTESDYLQIYNPETNQTSTFSDYPLSSIDTLELYFVNGFSAVPIIGKDQKKYFTVISDNGLMLFDPIPGIYYLKDTENLSDITAVASENEDGSYNICDIKGNILSQNLSYKWIGTFSEGLASATKNDGSDCYININGEIIIDKVVL